MTAPETLTAIGGARVVPVLVVEDVDVAVPLAHALHDGGLTCAEVTFRTPAAAAVIERMADDGRMIVGAGTVRTTGHVDEAIRAGARFIVSPGFSDDVVRHCLERGVAVLPGIATATELMRALDAGLTAVKLFPAAQIGGAGLVRALAAPFPDARFVPTGGITAEDLPSYAALPSVLAVGGSWMATAALLRSRDWPQVTRLAAAARAAATMTA
jgi:2-dehydro-3-deoxyphosphogluconate aldolase/(4S)-4-hydroxy-2-oxoglutarate aldolase